MRLLYSLCFFLAFGQLAAQTPSVSFEEWISLRSVGGVEISPNGKHLIYSVNSTNWKENKYDSEIWLSRDGASPFQLTRTAMGSSNNASFSPDGKWVSFLADRGNKTQLFLIAVEGGEAFPITDGEDQITNFDWKPDMTQIALAIVEQDSKDDKTRKEKYGQFGVEGEEYKMTHLWVLNFDLDSIQNAGRLPCYEAKDSTEKKPCPTLPKPQRLTSGTFTVDDFKWSPDGTKIAYSKVRDPLINSRIYSDIAILDLATKTSKTVVENPSSDSFERWSPDGRSFVYTTDLADTVSNYYLNNHAFIYELATGKKREILADVDDWKNILDWTQTGIVYGAFEKMRRRIAVLDPVAGKVTAVPTGLDFTGVTSFSKDGRSLAVVGRNFDKVFEVYKGTVNGPLSPLTNMNSQIRNWNTPVNEIISWKSRDGAMIEGVLVKPRNYDSRKKYPLLVVIHGGPTGIDIPDPVASYVYPMMQWCEKGALVLRVNYRGSAGYGEKFRSLNVRNLGVGDMWDVMSGVDFLQSKGMIDTSRMGCMGWSQGGYISAFLATNTNRFKAISVGAGISNWVTYYVNTDITPFTRQYLKATPWADPVVYTKTSPMTNINKASTPTLIQHGEFDRRVPIPNAYELYRGLQDRGIPSKLIVYKGFGHGITKPKERLAAIQHNWDWFGKYVFKE